MLCILCSMCLFRNMCLFESSITSKPNTSGFPSQLADNREVPAAEVQWMQGVVNYSAASFCEHGLADWTCVPCVGSTADTHSVRMVGDFANDAFGFVAVRSC